MFQSWGYRLRSLLEGAWAAHFADIRTANVTFTVAARDKSFTCLARTESFTAPSRTKSFSVGRDHV